MILLLYFFIMIFFLVYNIINGSACYKPESNKTFKIRHRRRRRLRCRRHRILNMVVKKRDVKNSIAQWPAQGLYNKAIVDND